MKVSMRGGFSDRNGIKPENVEIQLKSLDSRTRIQIQNTISKFFTVIYGSENFYWNDNAQKFFKYVIGTIYAEPVDSSTKYNKDKIFDTINNTISNDDYDDVLTLIEALAQYWDRHLKKNAEYTYYSPYDGYCSDSIFDIFNDVLKKEYVGYRFIDGVLSPISSEVEIDAISTALSCNFEPVNHHLSKANQLLADRANPDYENSIKESISAVEAMCAIITGASGKEATLGAMLKKLEKDGITIHSGLKSAFNTLYGYTSDANGIRHAGDIGGPSSTFEEAKFMLVSCSAFVNYLIALCAD